MDDANRVKKLEEALRPFVNWLERLEFPLTDIQLEHVADGYEVADGVTWGDLRAARDLVGGSS